MCIRDRFYGNAGQFVAEVIGVVTNLVVVGLMALMVYKLIGLVTRMRVDPNVELCGLDVPEMGTIGYVGESIPECPSMPNKEVS